MTHRFRRPAALLTATAVAFGVVACSSDDGVEDASDPLFGYALPRPIVTLNAASAQGAATDAAKVSARLYPGSYLTGPDGRLLPNTDLVRATPSADNGDIVNYRISDQVTYSDGAPVVCDDFLLTWVASKYPDLFSSDLGLTARVKDFNCDAGQRDFSIEFDRGMGSRYRELFSVGEVLPSHTVAERAGVDDVVGAIDTGDQDALADLGREWSSTFRVAETDPSQVPTYGPYRVASRGEDGSLALTVNPEWTGVRPGLDEVVMWSGPGAGIEGPDFEQLSSDYRLYVADVPPETDPVAAGLEVAPETGTQTATDTATETGAPSSETTGSDDADGADGAEDGDDGIRADTDETAPDLSDSDDVSGRFAVTRGSGTRVDGLTLSDSGIFDSAENRRAFARCVDRSAVADAVKSESGITVDEAPFRLIAPGAQAGENLGDIAARNNNTDTAPTTDRLGGTTVRVGYFSDVARYRAMVDTLVESCSAADVTVVPVPLGVDDLDGLGTDYDALLETRSTFGQNPQVSFPASSGASGTATVSQLRDAENVLADSTATVPLTAEPRSVAVDRGLSNVVDNPGETGMSWNMDRWVSPDFPTTSAPTTAPTEPSSSNSDDSDDSENSEDEQ
ncbi:ABC transporter substrate-binding protein [Corynebacterium sp. AOP12-C2-36]|uniref:ABC transporter substrate-binding protein n=1 Tax=Corynebacterium sp. AOP12-C2-36 TaxID=3457723 RepID=UPI00403398B6